MEIIKLPPDEWQAYRQIRLEALQDSPQAFGSTYAETVEKPESFWRERLAGAAEGKETWMLFARDGDGDGRIVGLTGAFLPEPGDRKAIVVSVFVTPEYRGKRVSTALMQAVLDALRQSDIHTVELTVADGQAAALALYRSFGFKVVLEIRKRMSDGQVHVAYTMRREL